MGWPKYLKKTYSKDDLAKKVLKKLQIAHDREFLASLFVSEKRGEWHLKADLTKEERKRLKKIVKEVKKGRGGVKTLPLVILLTIAGAAVVFTLFFKNPLASKLLTSSLESVFGATADAEGVEVSLVRMEFRWDRVAVADSSALDRNLFEAGETVIALNGRAALERKVVIESLVSRNAAWGTLRETPGELVSSEKDDVSGERMGGGLFSPDKFSTEQTDMIAGAVSDPEQFMSDQWDSLKTPALTEELSGKYQVRLDERKASMDSLRGESETVVAEGSEFLSRDFARYKNHPDEIPDLVSEAHAYYGKAEKAAGEISEELRALDQMRRAILEDKAALEAAKDEDISRIRSLVAMPEGGVRGMVDGMVRSYLSSLLGDKFLKAEKIARFVKRYRKEGEGDMEKEGPGRHGRVVSFASVTWPDFLLREVALSAAGGGFSWDAALTDLAGDPEQWDQPAAGHFLMGMSGGTLQGEGVLERRASAEEPSRGEFVFAGLPLETDALRDLGISRVEGRTDGTAALTVEHDGSWAISSLLTVDDPVLEKSGGDMVADVVYGVLSGGDWEITLTAEGRGDDMSLSLDWPLLDRVDDEVGKQLREQGEAYLADVQDEMLGRFGEDAGMLDDYLGDLDEWEGLLRGDMSALDSSRDRIGGKIEETKKEAEGQAQEEVNKLLEESGAADVINDAQKSLPKLF